MLENFYGYLEFSLLVGIHLTTVLVIYRYFLKKKRKHQKKIDRVIDKEW